MELNILKDIIDDAVCRSDRCDEYLAAYSRDKWREEMTDEEFLALESSEEAFMDNARRSFWGKYDTVELVWKLTPNDPDYVWTCEDVVVS